MRTAVLADNPNVLDGAKIIYDAEALFTLREVRQASLDGRLLTPKEIERRVSDEVGLARGAHGIISVSNAEAEHFVRSGFSNVFTLGHAVEAVPGTNPFEKRDGMLFVGPIHDPTAPNADSVRFLLKEVLPVIRRRTTKETRLLLSGTWCEGAIPSSLDLSSARVLGRVDDLTSTYNEVRVLFATRYSAGLPTRCMNPRLGGSLVLFPVFSQNNWAGRTDGKC